MKRYQSNFPKVGLGACDGGSTDEGELFAELGRAVLKVGEVPVWIGVCFAAPSYPLYYEKFFFECLKCPSAFEGEKLWK